MKVFIEQQRFNQPLIIIGLSITFIVVGASIFENWNNLTNGSLSSKIAGFSSLIIIILVAAFIFIIKLKTRIDEIGIHYQFYPLNRSYKTIQWNEIKLLEVRTYDAIWEYGGWGMKFTFFKKKNKCYTIKGDKGLQVELKNGQRMLIGTQLKEDLQKTLDQYKLKLNEVT